MDACPPITRPSERNEDAWPADEMLARTAADRLVYEPGKGWGYSNIGYTFVRRLIEQATDRPSATRSTIWC